MIGLPRWANSIRFRLSLFYALAAFTTGSLLIGGLYQWQVQRLDEPVVATGQLPILDPETKRPVGRLDIVAIDVAAQVEYSAYVRALDNLKYGSWGALGILFVVSFGTSWWVAGLALRPVQSMSRVAREITASDLSRRIALTGPEDELKGLADTFDEMLDRLETGFEAQRRFVQDASHELRNPLAVARTNLDLVLSDPGATDDELRRGAEVARRSTERMSVLVEDLLVQARSGVPEFALDEIDLVLLAGEVASDHQAAAKERKVRVEFVGPSPVPTVTGDGPALRRAIGNLVSNALKASPAGSTITLEVGVDHPDGPEHGRQEVTVAVRDRGPGIAEEDLSRVFDRFWTGATSKGGSGLGLSIVRHVVERHGGRVTVDSEVGVGSTFTLRLPTRISGPGRPPTPIDQ